MSEDSNFLQSDDEDWSNIQSIANSDEAQVWVQSAGVQTTPFSKMDLEHGGSINNNNTRPEDFSSFDNTLSQFTDDELMNLLSNPQTNSSIRTSIEYVRS
jgi:hypothetical protein